LALAATRLARDRTGKKKSHGIDTVAAQRVSLGGDGCRNRHDDPMALPEKRGHQERVRTVSACLQRHGGRELLQTAAKAKSVAEIRDKLMFGTTSATWAEPNKTAPPY
jgi:hypothetical protein